MKQTHACHGMGYETESFIQSTGRASKICNQNLRQGHMALSSGQQSNTWANTKRLHLHYSNNKSHWTAPSPITQQDPSGPGLDTNGMTCHFAIQPEWILSLHGRTQPWWGWQLLLFLELKKPICTKGWHRQGSHFFFCNMARQHALSFGPEEFIDVVGEGVTVIVSVWEAHSIWCLFITTTNEIPSPNLCTTTTGKLASLISLNPVVSVWEEQTKIICARS